MTNGTPPYLDSGLGLRRQHRKEIADGRPPIKRCDFIMQASRILKAEAAA